jgi:hypothetical protein
MDGVLTETGGIVHTVVAGGVVSSPLLPSPLTRFFPTVDYSVFEKRRMSFLLFSPSLRTAGTLKERWTTPSHRRRSTSAYCLPTSSTRFRRLGLEALTIPVFCFVPVCGSSKFCAFLPNCTCYHNEVSSPIDTCKLALLQSRAPELEVNV